MIQEHKQNAGGVPSILQTINSPRDLQNASLEELTALAQEIRDVICDVSSRRSVHFASNLGVVELTIALHTSFDFSYDRLVWDVGHQCYPHKLLTGRYRQFENLRLRGGLSGFPNPSESPYDLFMTGHAGCSVGTALGLALGDALAESCAEELNPLTTSQGAPSSSELIERLKGDVANVARNDGDDNSGFNSSGAPGRPRLTVAVVGDGAFSSGPIFEALNHAGDLQKKLLVILNDNKMSICKRVGGFGRYLDHLRMTPSYLGVKTQARRLVEKLPSAYAFFSRMKESLKAGLIGGALFEDLGFQYVGPINGHDIPTLQKYFEAIKSVDVPVLLHVLTEKGRGYRPAEIDPMHYHSSNPTKMRKARAKSGRSESHTRDTKLIGRPSKSSSADFESPEDAVKVELKAEDQPFTYWASQAIAKAMREDSRVCVVVAAMTQGNMLESVRKEFPARFFDVGICEAHAVNFSAGLAKAGMRPIVDIYSGFLQRAYDHLFQEASLQNLPILFSIDRAGYVGADGATHHGLFDLSYFRPFPNMTIITPVDALDVQGAFDFALRHDGPTSIRYPKVKAGIIQRSTRPFELGRAEVLRPGKDGVIVVCGGGLANSALAVAEEFSLGRALDGERLDVAVLSARFVKPIDGDALLAPLRQGKPVVTIEENVKPGGFGSALLELANDEGVDTRSLVRIGAPDYYMQHGTRDEELAEAGLDQAGIKNAFLKAKSRSR